MFSIIIPCYNLERFISKTIKSILCQTYTNFELILVNDGSTDKTLKILKKYQNMDDRVLVIDKDNGGVSSARNKGLKKAKGDYIYFLDGDDFVNNTLLETAKQVFEDTNCDIFSFGFNIVDENNEEIESYTFDKYNKKIFSSKKFMNLYFNKKIRQSMCSFIVKSDILIKNDIFFSEDIYYGEDQEVQLKAIYHADKIFYNSFHFFYYLNRSNSAVNKKININRIDLIKVMLNLKEYFINDDIDKKTLKELNNYISMIYLFLLREGIKKKATKKYFEELSNYSSVMKKASINLTKFGVINYLLSKLYLAKPELLFYLFKLVYKK